MASSGTPPGVVVLGGYVNGLGLVRALAAHAVRTAVVTTKPFDIAHRSRWADSHAPAMDLDERPERLVEVLEERASAWRGWTLLPTNDEALAALAAHHERLGSRYRLAAPTPAASQILLDKGLMLDAAAAVGVDTPLCFGPADEATAARPELRFPAVVKPLVPYRFVARFGAKLFVAHDRAELDRCVASLAAAGVPGQVLEHVPGPDSAIFVHCVHVGAGGEPVAECAVRKLRQGPSGYGDARVATLVPPIPALREATMAIVRGMGLRGFAAAEFKLDARDGRFRFIEVNGRSVVFNALLRRAGLDVAGLARAEAAGERLRRRAPDPRRGTWVHLHPDVLYAVMHRRRERLGPHGFVAPYRPPAIEAVWSHRDPVPFLAQWSRTAREAMTETAVGARGVAVDRTRAPVSA